MQVINFSSARQNLKGICDKVCESNEPYIITRKEGKNVVMMSLDQFNELDSRLQRMNSYYEKIYMNDVALEEKERK